MLDIIKKLFGDRNEREIRDVRPIVAEINTHYETLESLSDDDLRARTADFRQRISDAVAEIEAEKKEVLATLTEAERAHARNVEAAGGDGAADEITETLSVKERQDLYTKLDDLEADWLDAVEDVLEDILPEAFAVVKDTCRRLMGHTYTAGGSEVVWDMIPFDVQLIGGIVLHRGNVAEMKTGEGKTLVAVAPMYLNALVGRGLHVVTVNPYLAQRDSEWMSPVFDFHGLTVDCIDRHQPHTSQRRQAYRADITYGTNNEFGFDYLRDNSFVIEEEQLVQRRHHYAIVDEVDSVLIDEARTPLIISGPVPDSDVDQFQELRSPLDQLVTAQQRQVASYVREAEEKLKEIDKLLAEGKKKEAGRLEEEAGLAILRAHRGFPRNKRLIRLKGDAGYENLLRSTENFYLQDNAKRMPFVDEPLYFALDEKLQQIEMTDKGREFVAKAANSDVDSFIIPDMGEEVASIDREAEAAKQELYEEVRNEATLSDEQRDKRIQEGIGRINVDVEEKKRTLYSRYASQSERIHAVNQLLRAYTLYEKDVEYIVQDGKVMIVDEHTGRVLAGRRYSDGLHQAIEAKENVTVQAATQTYATITLQNYFRLYSKLAGMTGTAETEAEEFGKIYSLGTVVIPTNKPVVRKDNEDLVFRTKREKYRAVIDNIRELNEKGQPVLVGTTSVEVSESLARMLSREKIAHQVLNAKSSRAQAESEVVARAGQKGAVTIATNMAGRGTDIKLGAGVREIGGLAIIGTERHESRRIDNQLRGRAGRQGDPGHSVFYVSLEDELMRLFGHERTARMMERLGMKEGEVITHKWITKGIERAQSKVEQNNFGIRKRQLEYDDVLNAQREVIYDRRMHALKGERLRADILEMLRDFVESTVHAHYGDGELDEIREVLLRHLAFDLQLDREMAFRLGEDGLIERILDDVTIHYQKKRGSLARPFFESAKRLVAAEGATPERLSLDFTDGRRLFRSIVTPDQVIDSEGEEVNDALERSAVLSIIDSKWVDHLRDLDEIKEGVGLRAFGQKDPLVEYKMEAFRLFKDMIAEINQEVIGIVFKAGPIVDQGGPRRPVQAARPRLDQRRARTEHASAEADYGVKIGSGGQQSAAQRDPSVEDRQPVVVERRIGRNETVTVINPQSGERVTMKYKHALPRISGQGWLLVEEESD